MLKTILLLVLFASTSFASGQVYKWRDGSGATQYSDTPPPPGAKDVQKLGKPAGVAQAGAAGGGSAKPTAEQEAEFRKRAESRQEAEAKSEKASEDERARAGNCEQAKAQLAALEAGQRMARLNAQGERIMLDEADLAQAKVEAHRAVSTWCR